MKTIEGHKKFNKIHKSGTKIYAIIEQSTKQLEDSEDIIYVAKAVEITAQEVSNPTLLKAKLYQEVADPLFFKSERGEVTKEEWLHSIESIKKLVE